VLPQPVAFFPRLCEFEDSKTEEDNICDLNEEKGQVEKNKIGQFLVLIEKAFPASELWMEFINPRRVIHRFIGFQ